MRARRGPVSAGLREQCRELAAARRVTTESGRYKSLLSRAVSSSSRRVTSLSPLTIMKRPGTSGAVKQPEVGSNGVRRETIRKARRIMGNVNPRLLSYLDAPSRGGDTHRLNRRSIHQLVIVFLVVFFRGASQLQRTTQ